MQITTKSQDTAKIGVLQGADASSEWSQYGIRLVTAISGPIDARSRDEQPRRATLQVQLLPESGIFDLAWQDLSYQLQRAIECIVRVEKHPASLIQITVQILARPSVSSTPLQQRCRLLACAVNGVSAALLDSSICCSGVAAAVASDLDVDSNVILSSGFSENDRQLKQENEIEDCGLLVVNTYPGEKIALIEQFGLIEPLKVCLHLDDLIRCLLWRRAC